MAFDSWDEFYAQQFQEFNTSDEYSNYHDYNFNFTNYDLLDIVKFRLIEMRIVPIIFMIIFVVGVFGNLLVVVVFIKNPGFRTITNIFLLNLAVIDLVYLFICVPFSTASSWMGFWTFGNILCKFQIYLMVTCMSVHVMTLIAIGIDRYMAVVHPVWSKQYRTQIRTIIIVIGIWATSLGSFIVVFLKARAIPYLDKFYCIESHEPDHLKTYTMLVFILFYAIPQVILGFCYIQIARKMRTIANTGSRLNRMRIVTLQRRRRVLKVVFAVTLTFALCWLPLHSAAIIREYNISSTSFTYYLQIFSPCFSYATTAMNPVIYCFLSKTFREFFKATFTCQNISVNSFLLGDEAELMPHSSLDNANDRRHRQGATSSDEQRITTMLIQVRPADRVYTEL